MRYLTAYILISILLCSCDITVNENIRVEDGEIRRTGLTTVNGSIDIGRNCEIHGTSRSVNGRIEVGENSIVGDLQTVNGSVNVAENVQVNGNIASVNGSVECSAATKVNQEISTVNGKIRLRNTTVSGFLKTTNGDIYLDDNTVVHGDVFIEGESDKGRVEITITRNSGIMGDIIVDPGRRNVIVYLSSGGFVSGNVENAEIEREQTQEER